VVTFTNFENEIDLCKNYDEIRAFDSTTYNSKIT
jgi:hypothetical protein